MKEAIFAFLIQPLYLIFEFLFRNIYTISNNILITILFISLVVSVLCLPLYLRADFLQNEEKNIQQKMKERVNSIKKNFKGDERLLLLQTYYRQNNYHPIMSLRLSLSLLLQIPIFLAAYTFFNDLNLLNGLDCYLIKDLSKPDELININNFKINLLPILMTIVNLVASFLYTKNLTFKDNKLQIIVSALFLVLLYNCPSGLVLYWLFNNTFTLIKNLFLLFTTRENFLKYSLILTGITMFLFTESYKNIQLTILLLFLIILLTNLEKSNFFKIDFNYKKLFFISLLTYFSIVAIYIPTTVISTSPVEFIFTDCLPRNILEHSFFVFAGLILFWGSWIYYFSNEKIRKIISILIFILVLYSLTSLFLLKIDISTLSNTLIFEPEISDFDYYSIKQKLIHKLLMLTTIFIAILLVLKKKDKILINIFFLIFVTTIAISSFNFYNIEKETKENTQTITTQTESTYIKLSKTKKNILIIILDRAVNSYLPIIFEEHKYLKEKFKDFVYYPNTLSYAEYTTLGYLPILGGYEYSPMKINERDLIFQEKFYEATTMLPRIFAQNNWKTTVINPVDFVKNNKSIKNYYSGIQTIEIPETISNKFGKELREQTSNIAKRNMIYYSLFITSASELREFIYENGNYHNAINTRKKYNKDFLRDYAQLYYLEQATSINENKNTFYVLYNGLTHQPTTLKLPNYDILSSNNKNYSPLLRKNATKWEIEHYHVNVAALKLLSNYFDFLRKEKVWDNTRIIIVSDHGLRNSTLDAFESNNFIPFNPLLLVKEYNANSEFKTSLEIMTNADIPTIAIKNVLKNAKNPYTNELINNKEKEKGIFIKNDNIWYIKHYKNKTKILEDVDIINYVKGNPKEKTNWITNMTYKEALKLYKNLDNK